MARASSLLPQRVSLRAGHRLKPAAKPMPQSLAPMLASPSSGLPNNPSEYTFEYKWDGVRALCYIDGKSFRLESRNQLDITRRYPELHALADAIGPDRVILDGEIVSLDDVGRPSFTKLQRRMHLNVPNEIRQFSASEPVFYIIFDILYVGGRSVMSEPYTRRRQILEDLTLTGANWQVTPAHQGEGKAMLQAARRNGLEGLVAKRLDSIYIPGQRSPAWRKIKIIQRQEFVIGGWMPERTGAINRLGALLMGYYDCNGKLQYVGKVGTGLSAADHIPVLKELARHTTSKNPFAGAVPRRKVLRTECCRRDRISPLARERDAAARGV